MYDLVKHPTVLFSRSSKAEDFESSPSVYRPIESSWKLSVGTCISHVRPSARALTLHEAHILPN